MKTKWIYLLVAVSILMLGSAFTVAPDLGSPQSDGFCFKCLLAPRPEIVFEGCPPDAWYFTAESDMDIGAHVTFFTDGTNTGWIGHAEGHYHDYGKTIDQVLFQFRWGRRTVYRWYTADQACHTAKNCPECGDPIREMPFKELDLTAETYAEGTPVLMVAKLSHEPCKVCGNAVDGYEINEWNKLSNTSIVAVYPEPFMARLNWRVDNGNQAIDVEGEELVTPEGTWYVIQDDRVNKDSIEDVQWLDMEGNSITLMEDGEYVINPPISMWPEADINVIVAGSKTGVVMVEAGALFVPESEMIDAIFYGHEAIQPMLDLQETLKKEVGKPKREVPPEAVDEALKAKVFDMGRSLMAEVLAIPEKMKREKKRKAVQASVCASLSESFEDKDAEIREALHSLEKTMVREMILDEDKRIDGRAMDEVRPIECLVGLLPRIHGSALFTRGETQAIVLTTLGTERDEQRIESIYGEHFRWFILHYNFPPYSVGEARRLGGPGRREIGHGALARRALMPVLPDSEEFQYCIRVVSEILESNGSSSMATVCGGCLSLMDAGVPIKEPVAGVAMGLVSDGGRVKVLTDIIGDEDHYGDMDFKVTGTRDGVTALQMDIKIERLTRDVMQTALDQAKAGRLFILDQMTKTINRPRAQVSEYAPIISTIQIKPEKVRLVIGPGGKTIREICNTTEAQINVDDAGTVTIAAPDKDASTAAINMIKEIVQEAEVGKLYKGKVVKIMDFGAFVEILPGTDGLVHISQLAEERVNKVTDVLNEGDEVLVKVLEVGNDGRIRLSRKAALGQKLEDGE